MIHGGYVGSYMEKRYCMGCKRETMHENGNCIKCKETRLERVKASMRDNYYKLTSEEKLDYLFERLVIDAVME